MGYELSKSISNRTAHVERARTTDEEPPPEIRGFSSGLDTAWATTELK